MSGDDFKLRHYDPAVLEVGKALELAEKTGASQEVIDSLKKALNLSKLRDEFAESSSSKISCDCAKIVKETLEHDWHGAFEAGKTKWHLRPVMMSGPLEGQFLKSFVSAQKAKRVLEIGMYTGYGALSLAEALPADGELVSIELDPYLKPLVESLIKDSPHCKKVKIIIGPGIEEMKKMSANGEKFDAVFLDASKDEYEAYLNICFEENLLSPGGTVLVDNAFRHGFGYNPDVEDNSTRQFAKTIMGNSKLHKVLVPLRDGIFIIRRLSDVEGSV